MKFSGRVALALVTSLGALSLAGVGAAHADGTVPFAQIARLRDQRPASGTFDWAYKNYGEWLSGGAAGYYRKDQGTVAVKLNSYVIKEGMRKYDDYLLVVDIANTQRAGTSKEGWADLAITTSVAGGKAGAKQLVDSSDSKSITADPQDCQSFPVTLGAGWGFGDAGADASVQVGEVNFCDKAASWGASHPGGSGWATTEGVGGEGVWKATQMRQITHLVVARLVKVANGATPTFSVKVTVPTDSCTAGSPTGSGNCVGYKNDTSTYTRTIGVHG